MHPLQCRTTSNMSPICRIYWINLDSISPLGPRIRAKGSWVPSRGTPTNAQECRCVGPDFAASQGFKSWCGKWMSHRKWAFKKGVHAEFLRLSGLYIQFHSFTIAGAGAVGRQSRNGGIQGSQWRGLRLRNTGAASLGKIGCNDMNLKRSKDVKSLMYHEGLHCIHNILNIHIPWGFTQFSRCLLQNCWCQKELEQRPVPRKDPSTFPRSPPPASTVPPTFARGGQRMERTKGKAKEL